MMNINSTRITPVETIKFEDWINLWEQYLNFYETTLSHDIALETWRKLNDPNEPVFLFGSYVNERLVGLVHFLYHRTCWSTREDCYLQDLYTDPEYRKLGIAKSLINRVTEEAKSYNANSVYWTTKEDNVTARSLYEQVADYPGFVQYKITF